MFTLGKGVGPALFGLISDRFVQARKPVIVFAVLCKTALWILVISTFDSMPLPILYLAFAGLSILHGGALMTQVMIKEISPPHLFGTIYGIINGAGFYGTAAIQVITGSILNTVGAIRVDTEPVYSAEAYTIALSPIILFMLVASVVSFKLTETMDSNKRTIV
jgi:MFS family permease